MKMFFYLIFTFPDTYEELLTGKVKYITIVGRHPRKIWFCPNGMTES